MQIANLVLADGLASPANHTFEPFRAQNGSDQPAEWWDKTALTIAGYKRTTALLRRNPASKSTKVVIQIVDPTLAVTAPTNGSGIQPNPTVAYSCFAKIEFTLPDACTLQNRKDILAYVKNFMAHAVATDLVVNTAPQY